MAIFDDLLALDTVSEHLKDALNQVPEGSPARQHIEECLKILRNVFERHQKGQEPDENQG